MNGMNGASEPEQLPSYADAFNFLHEIDSKNSPAIVRPEIVKFESAQTTPPSILEKIRATIKDLFRFAPSDWLLRPHPGFDSKKGERAQRQQDFFSACEKDGVDCQSLKLVKGKVSLDATVIYTKDGKESKKPWVVCLQGMNGDYCDSLDHARYLSQDEDVNVLLFNYRGIGASTGTITSIDDMVEDAETAVSLLVDKLEIHSDQIAVKGFSLGGLVASKIESDGKIAGIFYDSTFLNFGAAIKEVTEGYSLPQFLKTPVMNVIQERFETEKYTNQYHKLKVRQVFYNKAHDNVVSKETSLSKNIDNNHLYKVLSNDFPKNETQAILEKLEKIKDHVDTEELLQNLTQDFDMNTLSKTIEEVENLCTAIKKANPSQKQQITDALEMGQDIGEGAGSFSRIEIPTPEKPFDEYLSLLRQWRASHSHNAATPADINKVALDFIFPNRHITLPPGL